MNKKSRPKYVPKSLEKIEREMHQRGIELTQLIRIFNMIKNTMPEGPREQFERIAKGYALRNDKDRGSVPKCNFGQIEFRDEGIRSEATIKKHKAKGVI